MSRILKACWVADDPTAVANVLKTLKAVFPPRRHTPETFTYQLLDTDDWSLWHSGLLCLKRGQDQYLLMQDDIAVASDTTKKRARFWWDFTNTDMRDSLKKHIKLRALIGFGDLMQTSTAVDLLNADKKTVARMQSTTIHSDGADDKHFLILTEMRGYRGEYHQVHAALNNNEALGFISGVPGLKDFFLGIGIKPRALPARTFGLAVGDAAENAVRRMSHVMVDTAFAQKPGILDDIDSEFLHNYRVNLRKARSLITLTKSVFVEAHYRQLKQNLSRLASTTNNLRDLDVLLLSKNDYYRLLPSSYEPGLDVLFKLTRKNRFAAYRRVCRFLRSDEYMRLVSEVNAELDRPAELVTAIANKPVLELAREKTLRCYKKIRKLARDIHENTPDEKVHEVRIECKKLRYLMEFFAELFESVTQTRLIKRLKKLQNILGYFNDYSVQKDFFADYAKPAAYGEEMVAAVNGLIAVLHQKQRQERQKVGAALEEFTSVAVAEQFSAMCHQ